MLGISIYPEKEKVSEIKAYLKLAAKYNFKRVFSCLLSVDKPKEEIAADFKEIIDYATSLGFEFILDIAPRVFDQLGISYNDLSYFADLGATGIRLDAGFDGQKEAQLTFNKYNLDIEIGMSSGTKYVDNIMSYNPKKSKLLACHNFYPMEFAGLSLEHFTKTSQQFKDYGIRTAAFVSSPTADHGPWPVMDGLCTLEMHRSLPLSTQVKHHLMMGLVDDIIIANAYASEEEMKSVSQLTELPEFDIVVNPKSSALERKILFEESHFNRGDISEYLVRSTLSRVKFKNEPFPPHDTRKIVAKGDIAIGNDNFGQYKGELHLTKKDHTDAQNRKNIVAKVVDHEVFLLDYLKPWSMFKFNEVKK